MTSHGCNQHAPVNERKWSLVSLFGGVQIWSEKMSCVSSPVEEEEEVTKVRIKTLEELNATVFSIVRTTCVVGIALLLGSGSLVGSSFLTTAVFIASFYYYTSHRIPVRKFIPGFKLAKVIHASPDEIFNMYMNLPQRPM